MQTHSPEKDWAVWRARRWKRPLLILLLLCQSRHNHTFKRGNITDGHSCFECVICSRLSTWNEEISLHTSHSIGVWPVKMNWPFLLRNNKMKNYMQINRGEWGTCCVEQYKFVRPACGLPAEKMTLLQSRPLLWPTPRPEQNAANYPYSIKYALLPTPDTGLSR